jgi:fluoroquinolone transport system permease protein
MKRLVNALALFLRVQNRSRFPHLYFGAAIATVLVLRWVIPADYRRLFVPVLLLGEIGSLGIFLVAAHRYFEASERSVTALTVTPLRSGEYVAALVGASAIVATLSGSLIYGGILGLDGGLLRILPLLFLTATFAGFTGLALAALFREFTRFILGSLVPLFLYYLPYLSYFGLAPRWAFVWLPPDASLFGFASACAPRPDYARAALYTSLLLAYNALAFVMARRLWVRRIAEGEAA